MDGAIRRTATTDVRVRYPEADDTTAARGEGSSSTGRLMAVPRYRVPDRGGRPRHHHRRGRRHLARARSGHGCGGLSASQTGSGSRPEGRAHVEARSRRDKGRTPGGRARGSRCRRLGCGERIRTSDLRVMSPTSCRCSTPRPVTLGPEADSVKRLGVGSAVQPRPADEQSEHQCDADQDRGEDVHRVDDVRLGERRRR